MKNRYVLFCLISLIFSTGCVLQAHLTPTEANASEGDTNLGSSQSAFTAVFKANNTHLLGLYDENTTAATIGGVCKPGDLIMMAGADELVHSPSVFCTDNGTWSVPVDLTVYPGYSAHDAYQTITASTRGSTNTSATIRFTYSPTTIPAAGAAASIDTYAGKTTARLFIGGQGGTGALSANVSHVGLTQKKQYQYRLEIYRSGSLLMTLGEIAELSTAIEVTSPYTWQNGDTLKATPFDATGDKPGISVSIPDSQPVSI
ncbi:hypothetical protein EZJ49_09120 [Bdellovibrio bacteriovorus]|uniref:hypothetical protein n=1 Tax=Bdellovibrio bacteriovorus TaxID=959 RepID=UPI0021D27B73|nr:hypothetical protein [Bdellovibrio bacteriovorus]UXR63238.1 hypothetical protein EZJ49_09120 [Bdellovibrio bacteriovorus]